MGVMAFLKQERGQYQRPQVDILTPEERLAAQARKATRFLNSKLIRTKAYKAPKAHGEVIHTDYTIDSWLYQRPGAGRPRKCTLDEALSRQKLGGGIVRPVLHKKANC